MRSLSIEGWPAADREAWQRACRPSMRLAKGGAASHLKEITRKDLARRYGYLLDHLSRRGLLDGAGAAGASVTPESVESFVDEAQGCWRSVTLAQSIYKLRRMAELLAPERDLSWLREIEKDLALEAYPKPRFDRIVTSEQLVEAGLTLIFEAKAAGRRSHHRRAKGMRDGLMLALLALCPIRIKNFASLHLGRSLRREGERWWIVLPAQETKSGRPDERQVPELLRQGLALYLTWARPVLLRAGEFMVDDESDTPFLTGSLWIGESGSSLSQSAVERAIGEATRMTLGVRLSPHDFRRCAAVTAAYRAGAQPTLGSALLQHTDRRVTDNHYNLASSLRAAGKFGSIIAEMRSRS